MTSKGERHTRDIRRYYFNLHLWTQLNQQFRAYSGVAAHAIHRSIEDAQSGEFSPKVIYNFIAPHLKSLDPLHVLDAGSGYGGACLDLHSMLGGRWYGVTLSARQVAISRRNADAMQKSEAVTFARQSYDDPLQQEFTAIIAIESLIHSADPERSIGNLAASLKSGGRFIIVDDMPVEEVRDDARKDLQAFKDKWRCPEMPSADTWSAILEKAGCTIETRTDLTDFMRPRDANALAAATQDITKRSWWRKWVGLDSVTDAEIGGLLLEGLGRTGVVRYKMIVATKK